MTTPLITFKAGRCEYDAEQGTSVKPDATAGYVYIIGEEDYNRFCWRPRSAPFSQPTLDLIMLPKDAIFKPYRPANAKSAIAGRIYVLKFSSSSDRYFFWLQSAGKTSNPSEFSSRDLKIGEIVNAILQGDAVDVTNELRNLPSDGNGDSGDEDDDTAMEDADESGPSSLRRAASGGAGPGATGGDIREEGEEAREGGADGGRANRPADATQAAVANFLRSLQGSNIGVPAQETFTTLPDLLPAPSVLPILNTLSSSTLDTLLSNLPPTIILLSSGLNADDIRNLETSSDAESAAETLEAIRLSLSKAQKRDILAKILRSPQFAQSLASLTHAIRDGGLPMIAEALQVPLPQGGLVPGGTVPLGAGAAVRAFVDGVKEDVVRKGGQEGMDEGSDEE